MSKENTPEKIRQRTLAFVTMFSMFLGTSASAGIGGFYTYKNHQQISYLEKDLSFINHQIRAEYQGSPLNQGSFFKALEKLHLDIAIRSELYRKTREDWWRLTIFASITSLYLLLLALFSLRQLQKVIWKDYLICYFPDEVVGELIAFRRELTEANKSTLSIETRLLYVVFTLIWAFYIQINIENLWLPSKDQRRR
jgi:hypothetical protein